MDQEKKLKTLRQERDRLAAQAQQATTAIDQMTLQLQTINRDWLVISGKIQMLEEILGIEPAGDLVALAPAVDGREPE